MRSHQRDDATPDLCVDTKHTLHVDRERLAAHVRGRDEIRRINGRGVEAKREHVARRVQRPDAIDEIPNRPVARNRLVGNQLRGVEDLRGHTREADAKKKGEYELLTKQMSDQHATEKKKLEERLMSVQTGRLNDHKKRVLAEEISTAKGKVKKLLDPIGKYVKVVELEDGSLSEQVVDDKGNVRIVDGQGTPMTVTQLIAQFSEDPDYMVDFEPSGTTGSGARNEGTPAGKGGVIIVPKGVEAQEYRRLKDEATKTGKVLKFAS